MLAGDRERAASCNGVLGLAWVGEEGERMLLPVVLGDRENRRRSPCSRWRPFSRLSGMALSEVRLAVMLIVLVFTDKIDFANACSDHAEMSTKKADVDGAQDLNWNRCLGHLKSGPSRVLLGTHGVTITGWIERGLSVTNFNLGAGVSLHFILCGPLAIRECF